jgi:hypothetical protein
MAQAATARAAAIRATYRTAIDGGLYWATYNEVLGRHRAAVARVKARRKQGYRSDLRFRHFAGVGTIVVQLSRGHDDPPRTPELLASSTGKWRNVARLTPWWPPEVWQRLGRGEQRRLARGSFRFRIGSGATAQLVEVPVIIHRPLPLTPTSPWSASPESGSQGISRPGSRSWPGSLHHRFGWQAQRWACTWGGGPCRMARCGCGGRWSLGSTRAPGRCCPPPRKLVGDCLPWLLAGRGQPAQRDQLAPWRRIGAATCLAGGLDIGPPRCRLGASPPVNGQVEVPGGGHQEVSTPRGCSGLLHAGASLAAGLAHAERLALGDHDDAVV